MKKSSQRRWRKVPKEELDALHVSRSGRPKMMTKADRTEANRQKENRKAESRRKALKRREEEMK
jgi:hypothetical protein